MADTDVLFTVVELCRHTASVSRRQLELCSAVRYLSTPVRQGLVCVSAVGTSSASPRNPPFPSRLSDPGYDEHFRGWIKDKVC